MAGARPGISASGEYEKTPVSTRVSGAILFGVVFLGTLIWGAVPFTVGVALFAAIGAAELYNVFEKKGKGQPAAALLGIATSVAYVVFAQARPIESFGYLTAALVFLSFLWFMLVLKGPRPTVSVSMTVIAPLFSGFCMSHLVLLRNAVDVASPNKRGGLWLILFLMVLIWIYDILAWAVGRKIGRHKMAPILSPNKSWEGLIAGTLGTVGAAVPLNMLTQAILGKNKLPWFSPGVALVISLFVCVLGPAGDLAESMIKRDFGVKDTGSIIPGHGGIMDRFDSTVFTAPAVFYYLYLMVFKP